MDNTALGAVETKDRNAELGCVQFHLMDLSRGDGVGNRDGRGMGGGAVVNRGKGLVRSAHLQTLIAEPSKGLR
jgi:hypothetical protein